MQVLRGITRQYANLFSGAGGEVDEGSAGNDYWSKWGWVALVNNMANNDRQKWDYYFDMNVIEFLNTVTHHKDKTDFEHEQEKKLMRKYGKS